jgi:hypothetical protein
VDFAGVTYVGPEPDDPEALERVPDDLRHFLDEVNGLVAFDGGLHIRGASKVPAWHSLRHVWFGSLALHTLYDSVLADDVPFAEDAVGDQWLLREGEVLRLQTESGHVEPLGQTFGAFLEAVAETPVDTLGLQPLMQFQAEGGELTPGMLLAVYPPFCTKESADGVTLRAISATERVECLADFSRQMPAAGSTFRIDIVE